MKTTKLILLLLVTLFTISCQHDEPVQQGNVQFSLNTISAANTGGRKQTDDIPDGASLIMSLTKSNGDSVFTWKKIDLLKIGSHYITRPLPLLQGDYKITDFMIVGSDNAVLYVAPKAGSSLAKLVTKPLPLSFDVGINDVSNVDVEVVDANHKSPEDFGYASFGVKVVPSSGFALSVFAGEDNSQIHLTAATAYVIHENDTVLTQDIQPTTNHLVWRNESDQHYTLVIVKDGYAKYNKVFRLDSLVTSLNERPLTVVLKPAFTMRWTSRQQEGLPRNPEIIFSGIKGSKFQIDWGDNSTDEFQMTEDYNGSSNWLVEVNHHYATNKNYFVSVTGDLNSLKYVQLLEGLVAVVDTVCVAQLPALEDISIVAIEFKASGIDFSHNHLLKRIDVSWLELKTLDISQNPLLTEILLDANPFPSSVMNKMIDDLYASVTLSNRRDGILSIRKNIFDPYSTAIIGPPATEQIQKLHSLVHDYGWHVTGQ